ncbi:MAG: hypothetical protein FJ207_10175 [Gemmatimonadetes bacterium]|nr:hypothetical protein [Gemmatimonadota bacterium]
MATEGPLLAAVIARLPDATYNLAAHGVAWALAILIEGPVMMLMSAATALAPDRASYLKLRAFSRTLEAATTGLLLLLLVPPVYHWVANDLMGLPAAVSEVTYGALWFFIPWPAAIGYRRFFQGVLIRTGRTHLVAYGTIVRLLTMASVALVGAFTLDLPGASLAAFALASGVCVEALVARWMAGPAVRALLAGELDGPAPSTLRYREIISFYAPLALTSVIALSIHPLLTFFMGRGVAPVESLAVFPVVQALSFVFRSFGLAYQDAAIALMGDRFVHLPELRRFGRTLGLATSGGLALVALTPLSPIYFQTVSGLTEDLAAYALTPVLFVVLMPALTVQLSLQRAILVEGRRTRPITVASAIEVGAIAACFLALGWGALLVGVTAAFVAFLVGRIASNAYLAVASRATLRDVSEPRP